PESSSVGSPPAGLSDGAAAGAAAGAASGAAAGAASCASAGKANVSPVTTQSELNAVRIMCGASSTFLKVQSIKVVRRFDDYESLFLQGPQRELRRSGFIRT